MIEDVDKIARDLPRVCLHGNIPTATTMALAARVVELLDSTEQLLRDLHKALHGDVCNVDHGDHTAIDIVKWVKAVRARAMKRAREVEELMVRVAEFEADNDALRQIIGECYRAVGVEGVGTLDETPGLVLAVMSGLEARAADRSKSADDALGRVAELEKAARELTSFWTGLGGGRVAVLSAAFDELRRVADQRGEVKSDG